MFLSWASFPQLEQPKHVRRFCDPSSWIQWFRRCPRRRYLWHPGVAFFCTQFVALDDARLWRCSTSDSSNPNRRPRQRKDREMLSPLRHLWCHHSCDARETPLLPKRLQRHYSAPLVTPTTSSANPVNRGSPPDLRRQHNQEFFPSSGYVFSCWFCHVALEGPIHGGTLRCLGTDYG